MRKFDLLRAVIKAQVSVCHLGGQILYLTFLSKKREDNNDVVALNLFF